MSSIIDPSSVPSPPGGPAWQVALLFPDQGAWSEEDYLALDCGRLVEFEDGCIEVLPMPTLLHQLMVDFLHAALKAFVVERGLGMAFFAPVPVRLRPGKYREPDVFFIREEQLGDLESSPDRVDLAMEVVSPGSENRARDIERKRKDYAKAGILEYWIIDPELQRISVLVLEGGKYRVHGEFVPGETATSGLLQGFAVNVQAALAPRPRPPEGGTTN